MRHRVREVDVVAAHRLQPRVVLHRVGGIRDEDLRAAEEERGRQLALGRQHHHPERFAGDRRHGDQVVLAQVVDRVVRAGRAPSRAAVPARRASPSLSRPPSSSRCRSPISLRRLDHLRDRPGVLLVAERNQFLRRVGDHLVGEVADQSVAAARRAGDAAVVGLARDVLLRNRAGARDRQLRACA